MKQLISGMSLTPQEAEKRRDQLAKVLMWGAIAGVGILVAPLIFTLLKATVALIVTAALAATTIAFAPVVAMKLANWKLQEIIDEAKRNPIPTLENELMIRRKALSQAREQLKTSLSYVESFVGQAEGAATKYPDMAARWKERAQKARALAELKKRSFQDAIESVNVFEGEVEKARTEWKLVLAEAAMNKSLNVIAGDPMAELRARTALESVTDRMNAAFAELEVALLDNKVDVDGDKNNVLNVQAIEVSGPTLLQQINAQQKVNA